MRVVALPVNQDIPATKAHDKLIVRTAAALARSGVRVVLLGPKEIPPVSELVDYYGIPVGPLPLEIVRVRRLRGFRYVERLFGETINARADAILTVELKVARTFAKRRSELNARLFYEAHDASASADEKEVLASVDGVLVPVATLEAKLRALHAKTAPIHVVPLAGGWGRDLMPTDTRVGSFVPRPIRLGYAGQLYPLQGVEVVLGAMAKLEERTLSIAGGKPDDVTRLEREAAHLGIRKRTRFLGYVAPALVPRHLREADVLVLPSLNKERMPYVAHTKASEYLAAAKPIVAADLPSLREELGDGPAVFVAPEDPSAWADAIRALEADQARRGTMANAARDRAKTRTWELRATSLMRCFDA
jgi:glycosyltransferase involved in cell wall biosynthesis